MTRKTNPKTKMIILILLGLTVLIFTFLFIAIGNKNQNDDETIVSSEIDSKVTINQSLTIEGTKESTSKETKKIIEKKELLKEGLDSSVPSTRSATSSVDTHKKKDELQKQLEQNDYKEDEIVISQNDNVINEGQEEIPSNIKLSYKSISINRYQNLTLTLLNAKGKVKWEISDSNILKTIKSFDNKCMFKAVNVGKATITAIYDNKKYDCTVTVK